MPGSRPRIVPGVAIAIGPGEADRRAPRDMRHASFRFAVLAVLAFALLARAPAPARAAETIVAVAANFTAAANGIGALFESATGHRALFSFGATGQLYTQIAQGAPFEVFLAADRERPARAVDEGLADAGSRFTYALGRLVLYSADRDLVSGPETLARGSFTRLAIADPETAPYGAAAVATMQALGVRDALASRLVQGTNIAQAFQFVETGNAELGFVALSQVVATAGGSRWVVPQDLHPPIAQDAVLLATGVDNEAARAFIDFLKGPEARAVIEEYGYGAGD